MPTFFGRRYMRDRVPLTESLVGAAILLLLATIVTGFVVGYRPSDRKLFDPDPRYVKGTTDMHVLRAGEAAMPTLPPSWRAVEPIEVIRGSEGLAPTFGAGADVFAAYDAAWTYRGSFAATDGSEQTATVTVFDMRRPRNAFGVCRARRPDGASDVELGRGGWAAGGRVGFWSGRHYVEIQGSAADVAMYMAQQSAAAQLTYGGPFEAESVLPADGRVPGSFRYVRRDALGWEGLEDAFLADYPNNVTAFVIETPNEPAASAVVAKFRERFGATSASDATPADIGARGAAGHTGDEHWLVAANGSTVVGSRSPDTADAARLVAAMDAQLSRKRPVAAVMQHKTEPAVQGHFPELPGGVWLAPTDVKRFNKDNLYEKIDGKAPMFMGFQFVELEFGTYQHTGLSAPFDVYVFNMSRPANAFGVYRAERSQDAVVRKLGSEGYTSGSSVFFWKNKYYVNVMGPADTPGADKAAEALAEAVARTIEDAGTTFWADAALPTAGRKANSLSYKTANALGHSFLSRVYVADYEVGGTEFQMFIHRAPDAVAAKALFGRYREAVKAHYKVVSEPADENGLMVSDAYGAFEVAFCKGPFFGGVSECVDVDVAKKQAQAFRDGLDVNLHVDEADIAPAGDAEASPTDQAESHSHGEGEGQGGEGY